jgi:putative ABC transport system permease protein
MLISLAPLVQSVASNLIAPLRGGATAGSAHVSRMRAALISTQAALCMILLIGAGLFAQSLHRVEGLDLGIDLDRTLMAKIDLGQNMLPDAEIEATYSAMLERVRAVRGVTRAALAEKDPYAFGRALAAHTPARSAESLWNEGALQVPMEADVDSGFFHAVGAMASLHGRDFEATDRRGAPRVAIINEPLARLLWGLEDPLGKCMLVSWEGGDCVTVVGVLRGFWKHSILQRDRLVVYLPMAQSDRFVPAGSMFIATRGNAGTVANAVRLAIQSVRPDMPAVTIARMSDVVAPELRPWRLAATMFGIFGAIAFLIAVVGLYGVVAFTAAQRSSEIALRIALGARTTNVLAVVARDGLRPVVGGLAFGVLATLAARRWIGPLLFQTSPSDPAIIFGVGALLLFVGAVASFIPTLRALRQNPAVVMRQE